ncbi:hypothetical protein DFAR_2870040 [Desulfarculales bacterium]
MPWTHAHPSPPALTLNLPETQAEPTAEAAPPNAPLLRLYNPRLLRHAYAIGKKQTPALKQQGYFLQGSVDRLWSALQPGSLELWSYRHPEHGYTLLQTSDKPPAGAEPLGRLRYVFG